MDLLRNLFRRPQKPTAAVAPIGISLSDDGEGLAEQLELCELELESTQKALEFETAEITKVSKQLREAEQAVVYLMRHRPCTIAMKRDPMEDTIAEIILRNLSRHRAVR